jgi:hypothetical protein
MAKILRYNLEDFNNITFDGFQIILPDDTLQKISEIALQVGSPTYIRTPVFNKKERVDTSIIAGGGTAPIKKRRNRNMESSNNEDWDTIRTFQSTKIEQKEGIDAIINNEQIKITVNLKLRL